MLDVFPLAMESVGVEKVGDVGEETRASVRIGHHRNADFLILRDDGEVDQRALPAPGPVEDLLLGPFDEDPRGGTMPVAGEEMQPAADGADVGVRLRLQIDVPPGSAARKLPEVQGRLAPGVAGRFRGACYG
jgi:hypothetical protein